MLTLDGKALVAEKNTVIQVILSGSTEGILSDFKYKISSDKPIVYEIMDKIKIEVVGLTIDEVINDIIDKNITSSFELKDDEQHIAEIIEDVMYKAAINYVKLQSKNPHVENKYEEE